MRTVEDLLAPGASLRPRDGLLDATDGGVVVGPSLAQRSMQSTLLPVIYERLWRPIGFTLAAAGRSTDAEMRRTLELLDPPRDAWLLDVACGPGNTTRRLARALGPEGRAVGLDAAEPMLRRAVADTADPRISYVLGDGAALPFAAGTFDAVTCLGALYLVDDADAVLAELLRVLAPGGRLVVLTSVHRGPLPRAVTAAAAWPVGLRVFGRDEITGALRDAGLVDVAQDVNGVMQLVGGRRPEDAARGR